MEGKKPSIIGRFSLNSDEEELISSRTFSWPIACIGRTNTLRSGQLKYITESINGGFLQEYIGSNMLVWAPRI